ncbi:transcriptional regulator Myc-2-like [Lethenteron reissneri]|uniref:transcriptional regulator Myc-2-like n=1 Tax=Lethenteron reissneri TaxID=7753 RepID=UPI002AB7D0EB|nr:transcriptional regulator Myc-2-like [Lethenteron reissneri]
MSTHDLSACSSFFCWDPEMGGSLAGGPLQQHQSTALSEDIWDKFQLLPTPPRSPSRDADSSHHQHQQQHRHQQQQQLDEHEVEEAWGGLVDTTWGCEEQAEELGEKAGGRPPVVLRDCMWSGGAAKWRLEAFVSERLAALWDSCVLRAASGGGDAGGEQLQGGGAPGAELLLGGVPPQQQWSRGPASPHRERRGRRKTASEGESDLSSESDSEGGGREGNDGDDDDDADEDNEDNEEEGEEEEEIDVVTVRAPRPTGARHRPALPTSSTSSTSSSLHRQQHNYAAASPREGPRGAPRPRRPAAPHGDTEPGARAASGGSPGAASDSDEPCERRRAHNILERRRRDDLRQSFAALRAQLPELASRAAKVHILERAAETARELGARERRLRAERGRLRARLHALRGRVRELSGRPHTDPHPPLTPTPH